MVSSHFLYQGVVGSSATQREKSLGLVSPEQLRSVAIEVTVVLVVAGTALKPVHELSIIYQVK